MHGGGAPAPRSHMSPLSPASDAASHKYGEAPGGDTLTDFVTLVCQEASNAQQVGVTARGHGTGSRRGQVTATASSCRYVSARSRRPVGCPLAET